MRLGDLVRHAPAFARGLLAAPAKPKSKRKPVRLRATPARRRPVKKAKPKRPDPRAAAPIGALDAVGFFLAAGLVLAWPREGGSNFARAPGGRA